MATLQKCIVCGHLIASSAPRCVGCGTLGPQARGVEPKKRETKTVWKVLLGLLLLGAIMTMLIPDNKQSSVAPTRTPDEGAVATPSAAKGWCLMLPDSSGWPPKYDTDAPLSKWMKSCLYDTEAQCIADKQDVMRTTLQASAQNSNEEIKRNFILTAQAYDLATQCVASNDPRLKEQ